MELFSAVSFSQGFSRKLRCIPTATFIFNYLPIPQQCTQAHQILTVMKEELMVPFLSPCVTYRLVSSINVTYQHTIYA